MHHAMVISYQCFGTTDWSHLVFWILTLMMRIIAEQISDDDDGTNRLSRIIGNKLSLLAP